MRTLTLEQWRVLTYVQQYTQQWAASPKLGDIKSACGMESKRATLDIVRELQALGLVQSKIARQGAPVWSVRVLPSKLTVGVMP